MSKKTKLIIVCAILLSLAVISVTAFWFIKAQKNTQDSDNVQFSNNGISLDYPSTLKLRNLGQADRDANFIFIANEPADTGEPFQISVKYGQGIEKAASLSRKGPIEMLIDNASRSYPIQYPEYKQLSTRRFEINGHKAAELIFIYKNKGELIRNRLILALKDQDTVFYVSAQTKDSVFYDIDKKYFDPIVTS